MLNLISGAKMVDYIDKYNLKSEGLSLEKQDSEEAIEFYNRLVDNDLFANDYYPYRRLVLMYKKTGNVEKQIETIRNFFKSGIYANEYQALWFENKLRILDDPNVDEYVDYFNAHSLENKSIANTPVPIADRIRKSRIFIESEEKYDKIQTQYAYDEKCSQLNRERKYTEYVNLLNHMIDDLNYNRYRYFQKLCIAYRRLDDVENELRVIEKYMNGESTRTKVSDEWFENRLKGIENPSKKVIHRIESENLNHDDSPLLEYDRSLSERENLQRKYALIEYGRKLTGEEKYNDAVIFYKYLANNTYFSNDYYPYRQLAIIYDELKEYNANLVNIKKLLYSKIYLNHYQFIWFSEKLRQLSEKTDIDDYTLQRWFDYYLAHGALRKNKINRFLADRFIRNEDEFEILSVDEFIHLQEYYALLETGRIYERVGNYEFAVRHYTDIIHEREYNYAEIYIRLLSCHERNSDSSGIRKTVKLYYEIPPRDRDLKSDEYFESYSSEIHLNRAI